MFFRLINVHFTWVEYYMPEKKGLCNFQKVKTFLSSKSQCRISQIFENWSIIKRTIQLSASTLHYQISVGVWLLIPRYFSSQHALIPYPMFIDFARNLNPIRHNLSNISFSDMFAFKMHQKGVLNGCKLLNFMKKNQSFAKKSTQ